VLRWWYAPRLPSTAQILWGRVKPRQIPVKTCRIGLARSQDSRTVAKWKRVFPEVWKWKLLEAAQKTSWRNPKNPRNALFAILGDTSTGSPVFLCPHLPRSSRGSQMCSPNPWDRVEVFVAPDAGTAEKNNTVAKLVLSSHATRFLGVSISWIQQ
jgi:hypothetical protein